MPLNRPALSLGVGPRSVQEARRWVVDTCHDIGRDDLRECAELGVSELVTNALLHGTHPISVRVRGTAQHPRVEVRDGSRERPQMPGEHDADEDLLLTFGRGLSIVARCADAWGAMIEDDGKIVWFAPAGEFAEDDGVEGVITGDEDSPVSPPEDPVSVVIRGVPVGHYLTHQRQFRELRREVRLLALAHQSDYPLMRELSELFVALERQLREAIGLDQLDEAIASGAERTDVDLIISRACTRTMARLVDMLDQADEFCRQQRLLSLARSPEERAFQRWYFGEFVRQARGEPAISWQEIATGAADDDRSSDEQRSRAS